MSDHLLKISDDFWNIRGEFKVGGLLDVGTHCSLVKQHNGKYVLLDAYTLKGEIKEEVDEVTNDGAEIEAIINVHPFHTVHVERVHKQYPKAKLFGTQRHLDKFPELPWESALSESMQCAELFAEDFDFSIPAGVDFIPKNQHLHFSSVLVYHRESKTIHSDDTLSYIKLPGPLGKLKKPEVSFHITLAQTLQKRSGAAAEFRKWAGQLADQWGDADNLCTAHSAALLGAANDGDSIADRIRQALAKVEKTLKAHENKFG